MSGSIIELRNLSKSFAMSGGFLSSILGSSEPNEVRAVDRVNLTIRAGEVLGLAGESGSGKSTTGMMLARLISATSGQILLNNQDLTNITTRHQTKEFRKAVQIVFQNPYESLNPRFTIYRSVEEPLLLFFPGRNGRDERLARVIVALERAGLSPVDTYLERYPHQLSGGQLQRVALARAISVEPQFLIADEPVSMLDVSIRAGVLNLLKRFAQELNMGILYISHDLSTMAHVCSRIAIMYLGRIVEIGASKDVLSDPMHPYARALAAAIPRMGGRSRQRVELKGAIPSASNIPAGCRFHPRCNLVAERCFREDPEPLPHEAGRLVACHVV